MDKEIKLKEIKTKKEADSLIEFFLSGNAFDFKFTKGEPFIIRTNVAKSFEDDKCTCFIALQDKKIVGGITVLENDYKCGGYFFGYFGVHKSLRRHGIGSGLFGLAEDFVKNKKGRYITIESGAYDAMIAARAFYEKKNYVKVSNFPDYYTKGEDRIDYYKKL